MLLCADIGGTKTKLALFRRDRPLELVSLETYASRDVQDLGALIGEFLAREPWTIDAVCLGVAGPVTATQVETTNLPWLIDANELSAGLAGVPVFLLNDLEALAYGVPVLREDACVVLNPGLADPTGTVAVIAAGTGLGEGGLLWAGRRRLAIPSEGGHADFAPRTAREMALLRYLLSRWPHVSYERVLSGPGIVNVFEFLRDVEGLDVPPALAVALGAGDPAAALTEAALAGAAPIASATLDMFVDVYGAEAGNLALKLKSTGGLYVGGGIAPKILLKLRDGRFRNAFLAKGRFTELLSEITVRVILDEHAALYGAAEYAAAQLDTATA
ncbi:MAG TPA: glucokinase [Candidatus Binatus sp.]|nr:glucokinase [Candidatus Binatus sp.]